MELLNNIWTALTTENEILINILSIPLTFVEAYVYMLLFTNILKINSNKKQKIIYIFVSAALGIICSSFIPKPYGNIITLVLTPFIIMFVFKVSFMKGIISEFIILVCVTIAEIIISRIFFLIFKKDYEICANIPLYR